MAGSDETDRWLRDAGARLRVLDPVGALALTGACREAGRSGVTLDLLEAWALLGLGRSDDAARLAARMPQEPCAEASEGKWLRALSGASSQPAAAQRGLSEALEELGGLSNSRAALLACDLAVVEARLGHREAAEILLGSVLDVFEAAQDRVGEIRVWLAAAQVRRLDRDPRSALEALADAEQLAGPLGEEALLVRLWWRRAELLLDLGDGPGGLVDARRALSRVPAGDPWTRGRLWSTIGRAHEISRDPDSALAALRRAAELLEGTDDASDARADLAGLLSRLGRLAEVRDRLEAWSRAADQHHRPAAGARLCALSLILAASDGDRAAWAFHWRDLGRRVVATAACSPALATHLHDAALAWGTSDRDLEAGAHPLSRPVRAVSLALDVWTRTGRTDDAVREARVLHDLGARGAPIPAGPFDLSRRIGEGAVGQVWRAKHHDRHLVVAVKVLAHQDPRLRESFHAEVRAAASLDHPNIVRVFGTGVLGPESEAVGHGQVRVESPWCAMEFADGGTLEAWCGRLPWSQCRAVLVSLLDALAHAHARGVVHLDLKPSNVLLRGTEGVVLSDFGLAKVVNLQRGRTTVAGTPQYMAPEQFRADARDYGPWTDLYALGCLAVQLVTGLPPFPGATLESQREAHLSAARQPLSPTVPVPLGYDGWIDRLMERDPAERFQRAADAAWALGHLVDPASAEVAPAGLPGDLARATTHLPRGAFRPRSLSLSLHSLEEEDDGTDEGTLPLLDADAPVGAERAVPGHRPPCPDDWRSVVAPTPGEGFADMALSLVELRRPALVGRERERDHLWAELVSVSAGRGARTVTLRGPKGVGKSALSRWLAERAHELGVATVLDAAPGPDGRVGLTAIVARHLRLEGLGAEAATHRIHRAFPDLPAPVVEDLAILVVEHGVAMATADRVGAVVALASRLAAGRALVVRLEPGEPLDPDQLWLARLLVRSAAPVLIVLELSDEAVAGPVAELELADLGGVTLDLAPMSEPDLLALLDAVVPLAPVLRARLASLCGDNPDLLLRMVHGLAQRDDLERGADGWQLCAGVVPGLPEDLARTWAVRVDAVVARLPPNRRAALCGAALLGRSLSAERLAQVCAAVGEDAVALAEASDGLLRLPVGLPPRWVHPAAPWVLREEWADLGAAQAAASVVEHAPGAEALYAELLVRAGRLTEAVVPLLQAAENALEGGDAALAIQLLDQRLEILRSPAGAGVEEPHAEVPDAALRARVSHRLGSADAATRAAIAVALAERHDAPGPLAEALLVKASETWARGNAEGARQELRRAVEAFSRTGDAWGTGRALRQAGELARAVGDVDAAVSLHGMAVERLADAEPARRASLRAALAESLRQRGDLEGSLHQLQLALAEAGLGPSVGRAEALQGVGDLARDRGDPTTAEAAYRAALSALPWHDAPRVREVQLRRVLVRLVAQRTGEARALIDGLLASIGPREAGPFVARCRLAELVLLARADDRTWSTAWEQAVPAEGAPLDRDVAWLLDLGGQRAGTAGRPERSERLFEASIEVYRGLGLEEAAADVARRAATERRPR